MELKVKFYYVFVSEDKSFNRTFMELKVNI